MHSQLLFVEKARKNSAFVLCIFSIMCWDIGRATKQPHDVTNDNAADPTIGLSRLSSVPTEWRLELATGSVPCIFHRHATKEALRFRKNFKSGCLMFHRHSLPSLFSKKRELFGPRRKSTPGQKTPHQYTLTLLLCRPIRRPIFDSFAGEQPQLVDSPSDWNAQPRSCVTKNVNIGMGRP